MTKLNPWTLVEKIEQYACRFFTVRDDLVSHLGGPVFIYNTLRMKFFGTCVIPVDEEGRVILVGQYRYVTDRYSLELPGGGGEQGRPAIDAARNELAEETGYRADHWLNVLSAAASPGTSDDFFEGFVAWGLHQGDAHPEPGELLTLERLPFADAVAMALSGEINHLGSVALLLVLQNRLSRGDLPPDLAHLLAAT